MVAADMAEALKSCELFASLAEEEMQALTGLLGDACEWVTYEAGEHVFDQGEISSRLYVIASGQVLLQRSVSLGRKDANLPLGLLGRGRAMGWSALLYGPRYATASAMCQKPSELVTVEGAALRAALEQQPVIGFKVMDRLASMLGERLRAAYNTMDAHL
jgi:CRP-like cAMP-binding protein